jgi:splicing factor 45
VKQKPVFPKTIPPVGTVPKTGVAVTAAAAPAPKTTTLADWTAADEDEWRYGIGEKRQRGGRKKKKKKMDQSRETDWDELYDPSKPTNVEEYLRSDERIREVREWRELLYRHRRKKESSYDSDEEEDSRPSMQSKLALAVWILVALADCRNRSIRAAGRVLFCSASSFTSVGADTR